MDAQDKDNYERKTLSLYVPMTKIIDHLFLGSMLAFDHTDMFSSLNIKHVISLRKANCDIWGIEIHKYHSSHKDFCHNFPKMIVSIFNLFQKATSQNENIFIHCKSGQHRSATIVIAILMKFKDMTFEEAFNYVKNLRCCVEDVYIIDRDNWTLSVNPRYFGYFNSRTT